MRQRLRTEENKGVEALRFERVHLCDTLAGSATYYGIMGPFEVDVDIMSISITSGTKPAASGSNTLDILNGRGTSATGTLTFTGQPADTETVTINSKVYTFQASLTNSNGNVKIGTDTATSIANLAAAINLGAGSGTAYAAAMTLHTTVTAVATATTLVVTDRLAGIGGNSYGTTTTIATNATWGAATMAGGAAGASLMTQMTDALTLYGWTTQTTGVPVSPPVIQTAQRVTAGTPLIIKLVAAGDNSAAPTMINVRVGYDIPIYDMNATTTVATTYDSGI